MSKHPRTDEITKRAVFQPATMDGVAAAVIVPVAWLNELRDHARAMETQLGDTPHQRDLANACVIRLTEAATALRAAQRAYLADRGNEALGKKVGEAAQALDAALEATSPPLVGATFPTSEGRE